MHQFKRVNKRDMCGLYMLTCSHKLSCLQAATAVKHVNVRIHTRVGADIANRVIWINAIQWSKEAGAGKEQADLCYCNNNPCGLNAYLQC